METDNFFIGGGLMAKDKYKLTLAQKLYKRKNPLLIAWVTFLVLAVVIAVLTFYGISTSGYTISLDKTAIGRGISLSKTRDFKSPQSRLTDDPVSDLVDMSYLDITKNDLKVIRDTDGLFANPDKNTGANGIVSYTFYVRNDGDEEVYLDCVMEFSEFSKNVDEAMWVWVFFGDDDEQGHIYQKKDSVDYEYPQGYPERSYFENDNTIFSTVGSQFKVGEVKKITIITWIDGWDPDCTNKILGGTARYSIQLSIRDKII
jgi:hypothetical protein